MEVTTATTGQLTTMGRLATCGGVLLPCYRILCPAAFPQTVIHRERVRRVFSSSHTEAVDTNSCALITCLFCGLLVLFVVGSIVSSIFDPNAIARVNFFDSNAIPNVDPNMNAATSTIAPVTPVTTPIEAPVATPIEAPLSQTSLPSTMPTTMPTTVPETMPTTMPTTMPASVPQTMAPIESPVLPNRHFSIQNDDTNQSAPIVDPITPKPEATMKNYTFTQIRTKVADEAQKFYDKSVEESKTAFQGILKGGERLFGSYSRGISSVSATFRNLTTFEKQHLSTASPTHSHHLRTLL